MKKNIDKLWVIALSSFFAFLLVSIYWVDFSHPKNIDIKNQLSFGNPDAKVQVVVFEDFKCDYCKKYASEDLIHIKQRYIDTNKIGYTIIPIAKMCGSKSIAHAVIAMYELKKEDFFKYLELISQEDLEIDSKGDLVKLTEKVQNFNVTLFNELIQQEVFTEYLNKNLASAKSLMKRAFHLPVAYINGEMVEVDRLDCKIQEALEGL